MTAGGPLAVEVGEPFTDVYPPDGNINQSIKRSINKSGAPAWFYMCGPFEVYNQHKREQQNINKNSLLVINY